MKNSNKFNFIRFLRTKIHNLNYRLNKKLKSRTIRTQGFKILNKIQRNLEKLGIIYFIDFGTLLGMVREKNFLGHDLDIDVGVIINDTPKELIIESMLNEGFVLERTYKYKGEIIETSFLYKGVKFDINYYINDDKNSRCWLMYNAPNKEYESNKRDVVELKYSLISETEYIYIRNNKLSVPKNAEKLLEEKYGESWRIPNRNWIYWEAPTATKVEEQGIIE